MQVDMKAAIEAVMAREQAAAKVRGELRATIRILLDHSGDEAARERSLGAQALTLLEMFQLLFPPRERVQRFEDFCFHVRKQIEKEARDDAGRQPAAN